MNHPVFYTKVRFRLLWMTRAMLGTLTLLLVPRLESANVRAMEPASQLATSPTPAAKQQVGYEKIFPAMGTLVTFKTFHADRELVAAAFRAAEQRVQELAAILTDYVPASETRQLTRKAFQQPTHVSPDLWQTLVASESFYRRTNGAFDSSLGALTSLWRKYRRAKRVPSAEQIQEALAHVGWQHVELDHEQRTVKLGVEGLRFDFGAIGKGYVADEAFEILEDHGLTHSLVNISGNMRLGAPPPNRAGWIIEVAPVESGGQPLRHIQLADAAVATSGDLWQYLVIDGQRRSHILDPHTGMGVVGPVSATVVAQTATSADALATAACILDWNEIQSLLADAEKDGPLLGAEVLVARRNATEELQVHHSAGFPADLGEDEIDQERENE